MSFRLTIIVFLLLAGLMYGLAADEYISNTGKEEASDESLVVAAQRVGAAKNIAPSRKSKSLETKQDTTEPSASSEMARQPMAEELNQDLGEVETRERIESDRRSREKAPSKIAQALVEEGIEADTVESWFRGGEPKRVNYWKDGELTAIDNEDNPNGTGKGTNRILNLSDRTSIERTAEKRRRQSAAAAQESDKAPKTQEGKAGGDDGESKGETSASSESRPGSDAFPLVSLGGDSYEVVRFLPGLKDDNESTIEAPQNIAHSARGPDNHFEDVSGDPERMRDLLERTISLGHGGEIVIGVTQGGYVSDQPGADFVIYENPFRITGAGIFYHEFARVGVAEEDEDEAYVWFHCDPEAGETTNCAGVVPTDEGGDRFDLGVIGVDMVRYIKIRDTGLNHNNMGNNGYSSTEGFDLDALKLIHAFTNEQL